MKSRLCATLVLILLASGCATKGLHSEFDDVPVPRGLTYQPDRSVVIESPTIKAGELVYRGRLEPESLGLAMRTLVESNGWRHVNTTTSAPDGTRQVYEKAPSGPRTPRWPAWTLRPAPPARVRRLAPNRRSPSA